MKDNTKAVESPHIMVLDQDLPVGADLGRHLLLVAQTAHQDAGPAVDEALQAFMAKRKEEIAAAR